MADEQSTGVEATDVADTSAEVEDTSTEETDGGSLEDIEVDLEDESEQEDQSESEGTETEEQSEEEAPKEKELSEEEKQKAFNKEMAEKRIREKQQREQTLKEQQEEYLAKAEDNRDLAVRQLQIDAYNNKVDANTNKLTNGYERALKDFPILSEQSPEIKAEVDQAIDAFQAMSVTLDSYGNPIEVRGDLYAYLQSKADSIERLTQMGARKQDTAKTKEKSKVMAPPSRAPQKPKVDPDMAAFDEEAAKW